MPRTMAQPRLPKGRSCTTRARRLNSMRRANHCGRVHASYTIEAGSARLADTYLTPLKYRGWHTGVDYTRYQAMGFDPENWTMSLHAGIGIDRCENPAGNASMWSLMLNADWGMMRKFRPAQSLTLAAGAPPDSPQDASTMTATATIRHPPRGHGPSTSPATRHISCA